MKIAVLGANGFIGNHLTNFLSKKYEVIPVTRQDLNLFSFYEVTQFLLTHKFDYIINSAVTHNQDTLLLDTRNNLSIFMNFYNNSEKFGKFIHLGSGAEFDRTLDITNAKEIDIFNRNPNDSYGFSHNLMSRLCYEKDNFLTVRIFGCFGSQEKSTRLIPRLLASYKKFHIQNDRYFDYISIQDLCIILQFIIDKNILIKDINCVYNNKIKLSEFLQKFIKIHNISINIVTETKSNFNYTGNGNLITNLNIELEGLDEGIKKYFDN